MLGYLMQNQSCVKCEVYAIIVLSSLYFKIKCFRYLISSISVVLFAFLASCFADQTSPGTSTRPILTATEAASYTKEAYLQGWTPASSISILTADYVVGTGGYTTIQAAVNAAVNDGGTTRKYIMIAAGTYNEVVYVPKTKVPLTFYGAGGSPSNTIISLELAAQTLASDYISRVNGNGTAFKSGDPAYSMYEACASKTSSIGTACSTVFWVLAGDVEVTNLTIENTSSVKGDDQALAVQATGDKVQMNNVRLLSHQDTLCSGDANNYVQRAYISNSYIEGDIDFVFGGASTVFDNVTFYVKGDRRTDVAVIFAPDTNANKTYGYLAINSRFTGDDNWFTSKKVSLARAWDSGTYVVGTSPNGQVVIRDSVIDGIFNTTAPYTESTGKRAYVGNVASGRNLNDNNFNRFWEYNNSGDGA